VAATYRAAPRATLLIEPLDTLTAVYHRASGQTHLLAAPAPELIEVLDQNILTLEEIMAALAARFELGGADPQALAARLDELVAVALVERQTARS